jgi:thymidylate synthase
MTAFDRIYRDAIAQIMLRGSECFNERTGYSTRAVPGLTYELQPSDGFPLLTLRKIPIRLFCSEVVWMVMGTKDLAFIQQFTRIWDDFAESDNSMETAYGYRWRHHFGRDQLLDLLNHLREEPTSRQGVIMMWDAGADGLKAPKKKNVPCPVMFTANIMDGALNFHLVIRSNDMMLGNPHDVAGFGLLQAMLGQELGVSVGKYTVSISHAHVYENHYSQAETIMNRMPHQHAEILCRLPERSFERALKGDVELVKELSTMFTEQYAPMPAVEKMQIAL